MKLKEFNVLIDTFLQQALCLKVIHIDPNKEQRPKNKINQITKKASVKTTEKQP